MTNNNHDPKDLNKLNNLNNEEVSHRVEGVRDDAKVPATNAGPTVDTTKATGTPTTTAGSTAVAENQGGGWWKWLLGLLALLLIGWLLYSIFAGNKDNEGTTGETSTSIVATETVDVTETEGAQGGAEGAAQSATEGAGDAVQGATERAGEAANKAGDAVQGATEGAGEAANKVGDAVQNAVPTN
ncbi:hypothetical protein [Corynebacterium liangguodongii]|uniref:Uncharacterized protein n=1 Tax=Corynebacterium liangguodongii TaxID=2079535 RepID=A0A2S0WDL7_9CORY|nr:hypothetical protein [Corynebacterium liangguodongii]AWB83873.1 hypothetical protein C3E79_04750 [Corynebacterium liangguodongii]PWB99012.1 hypothetical protein DF219_08400 [Corynebacterium liangguodongii]